MSRKASPVMPLMSLVNRVDRHIREFRNVLERLIILCRDEITGADVVSYAKTCLGRQYLIIAGLLTLKVILSDLSCSPIIKPSPLPGQNLK